MPGTIGALWGLPLAYAIGQVDNEVVQMAIIGVLILLAVPVCTAAARRLGRKDPGAVTLDEIVSVPITFFLHPIDNLAILAVGFVLHRVFDILKPPPARAVERLPDGWGIVADDLVASVFSNLALWLVIWLGVLDRFL
jgi:phosphatidylglycerophosphatase A